jgi:hypothetical protein
MENGMNVKAENLNDMTPSYGNAGVHKVMVRRPHMPPKARLFPAAFLAQPPIWNALATCPEYPARFAVYIR